MNDCVVVIEGGGVSSDFKVEVRNGNFYLEGTTLVRSAKACCVVRKAVDCVRLLLPRYSNVQDVQ